MPAPTTGKEGDAGTLLGGCGAALGRTTALAAPDPAAGLLAAIAGVRAMPSTITVTRVSEALWAVVGEGTA
ncbi:MAG TPA: hypothetical protein VJQ47_02985 [Steroidobacteraceae bacterium]|nr:hypothetical protein [Steroidobacteraceae bacterium]